jgi:hypothetical protein
LLVAAGAVTSWSRQSDQAPRAGYGNGVRPIARVEFLGCILQMEMHRGTRANEQQCDRSFALASCGPCQTFELAIGEMIGIELRSLCGLWLRVAVNCA